MAALMVVMAASSAVAAPLGTPGPTCGENLTPGYAPAGGAEELTFDAWPPPAGGTGVGIGVNSMQFICTADPSSVSP